MLERVARAARFGLRAGAWGGVCFGAIGVFVVGSRAALTLPEIAVTFLGWFAAFFVLTFALAYVFPPPANRLEFPGAGKIVWLLVGLLFLATGALVWLALSSQKS